jgi:hypothetical protein
VALAEVFPRVNFHEITRLSLGNKTKAEEEEEDEEEEEEDGEGARLIRNEFERNLHVREDKEGLRGLGLPFK